MWKRLVCAAPSPTPSAPIAAPDAAAPLGELQPPEGGFAGGASGDGGGWFNGWFGGGEKPPQQVLPAALTLVHVALVHDPPVHAALSSIKPLLCMSLLSSLCCSSAVILPLGGWLLLDVTQLDTRTTLTSLRHNSTDVVLSMHRSLPRWRQWISASRSGRRCGFWRRRICCGELASSWQQSLHAATAPSNNLLIMNSLCL